MALQACILSTCKKHRPACRVFIKRAANVSTARHTRLPTSADRNKYSRQSTRNDSVVLQLMKNKARPIQTHTDFEDPVPPDAVSQLGWAILYVRQIKPCLPSKTIIPCICSSSVSAQCPINAAATLFCSLLIRLLLKFVVLHALGPNSLCRRCSFTTI